MTAPPFPWGPWIRHDGTAMPVPAGTLVEVFTDEDPATALDENLLKAGVAGVDFVFSWLWTTETRATQAALPIDYYRVKRPAGLDLLVSVIADSPVFEEVGADRGLRSRMT